MNIKRVLYNLIIQSAISYLVISFFPNITLPTSTGYFIAFLLMITLSLSFAGNLLRFLTIRNNFLTYILASTVCISIALFLAQTLLPGFLIDPLVINTMSIGSIIIKETALDMPFNLIIVGFAVSLFISFLNFLKN